MEGSYFEAKMIVISSLILICNFNKTSYLHISRQLPWSYTL